MSPDGLHLADVLGHGELMIVGAVIAAGALGEFVADALDQPVDLGPRRDAQDQPVDRVLRA